MLNNQQLNIGDRILGTFAVSLIQFLDRLAYYGFRVILFVWMIKELQMSDSDSASFYGLITGMIYLVGVPGGLIADLWSGHKRMIIICCSIAGIALITAGYLPVDLFKVCIVVAVIFIGAMKPSQWTLAGRLFKREDGNRDAAFLAVYVAINIGALLATTIIPYIGESINYELAFTICGCILLLNALVTFLFRNVFKSEYVEVSKTQSLNSTVDPPANILRWIQIIVIIAGLGLFWMAFELLSAGSWEWLAAQEQFEFLGFKFKSSMAMFFNPFFLIIMSFILFGILILRESVGKHLSWPTWGAVTILSAIFAIFIAQRWADAPNSNNFILMMLIMTFGELTVNLLGVSTISRLAPQKLMATTLGLSFVVFSISNYLSSALSFLIPSNFNLGLIFCALLGVCGVVYLIISRFIPKSDVIG